MKIFNSLNKIHDRKCCGSLIICKGHIHPICCFFIPTLGSILYYGIYRLMFLWQKIWISILWKKGKIFIQQKKAFNNSSNNIQIIINMLRFFYFSLQYIFFLFDTQKGGFL